MSGGYVFTGMRGDLAVFSDAPAASPSVPEAVSATAIGRSLNWTRDPESVAWEANVGDMRVADLESLVNLLRSRGFTTELTSDAILRVS